MSSRLRIGVVCILLAAAAFWPPTVHAQQGSAVRAATEQEVRSARGALGASLGRLEQRMGPGSANAEAWKDYLRWDDLSAFAAAGADPPLPELQAALDRLRSGEPGLELAEFQRVADDGQRLFHLLLVNTLPDPSRFAAAQQRQLDQLLESDPGLIAPRSSYAAEQRLDFFRGAPGGESLAEGLSGRFDQPNIRVDVALPLLQRVGRRPVAEVSPVTDNILGTRITGTGDTNGSLGVHLVESSGAARLLLTFNGVTHSRTVGHNGPAVIHSTGATSFSGSKSVAITRASFQATASSFQATTSTRTTGVCKRGGGFGQRIVQSVAKRKIAEQKACAESIASDHAEARLASEFDRQVAEELGRARRGFEQEFLAPLKRRHAEPRRLDFASSRDWLSVVALQAGGAQLAAPQPPPSTPRGDLSLRLHQSGANNVAAAILSGATISRDSADRPTKIDVPVPDWAKRLARQSAHQTEQAEPEEFKPWSITLRRNRPLSFRFSDSEVEVVIHAARVGAGEDAFSGWDIILRFEPASRDGRAVLVRQGEVDALPTDFDPRRRRRLSSRQVAFRTNLKAQLNQRRDGKAGIPELVDLGPIELRQGRGELAADLVESASGWLSVSWVLD